MGEKRGMKALEVWCKRVTEGYHGVKVGNMTTSWRDGLAFCAIIHHFRPDLIDFDSLDKEDIYGNNELAFRTAEHHLGIPALLDAEDMVEYAVPDRLSILTYLSQFYQTFVGSQQGSSPVRAVPKRPISATDRSVLDSPSASPPTKVVGRREPCTKCGLPVFIAERLLVGRRSLYHRTCFRCARCQHQLSLANCYETEEGQYCCETCPDEVETPDKARSDNDAVPQRQLHDDSVENGSELAKDDQYSAEFESALEESVTIRPHSLHFVQETQFSKARSNFMIGQLMFSDSENNDVNCSGVEVIAVMDKQNKVSVSSDSISPLLDKPVDSPETQGAQQDCIISSDHGLSRSQEYDGVNTHINDGTLSSEIGEIVQNVNTSDQDAIVNNDMVSSANSSFRKHSVELNTYFSTKTDHTEAESVSKLDDNIVYVPVVDSLNSFKTSDSKDQLPTANELHHQVLCERDKLDTKCTKELDLSSADEQPASIVKMRLRMFENRDSSSEHNDKASKTNSNRKYALCHKEDNEINSQNNSIDSETSEDNSKTTIEISCTEATVNKLKNELHKEASLDDDNDLKKPDVSIQPKSEEDFDNNAKNVEKLIVSPCPEFNKTVDPNGTSNDSEKELHRDSTNSVNNADTPVAVGLQQDEKMYVGEDEKVISDVGLSEDMPLEGLDDTLDVMDDSIQKDDNLPPSMIAAESELYPEELNPFGDEDEDTTPQVVKKGEEAEIAKIRFGAKPPRPPLPAVRQSLPAPRKVVEAPIVNLNPFWSDGEEPSSEEESTQVASRAGKPPVPMPRTVIVATPEPSPVPRKSALGSKFGSVTSLSSVSCSTPGGTARRKKKPAPAPPNPRELFPVEHTSASSSRTSSPSSLSHSPRTIPRHRKSRPAPPPPDPRLGSVEWEREKNEKDAANRNRQSLPPSLSPTTPSDYASQPGIPNKSTFGQWKRKKGPAPPRPVPQRRQIKAMPMKEVKRELDDIEVQQQELERQGVTLEQTIRHKFEQVPGVEETSFTPDVEDLVLQLFELVNEKNELFRRQAELMYLRRQQRLEEEHADLEYQIRCLMEQPEHNKTDSDKAREEELIQRLVEVVGRRNDIVECLEMDRRREAEEDYSIHTQLGIFAAKGKSGCEEESPDSKSLSLVEKKKKKKNKKDKDKSSGRKGKKTIDADKDIDETEEVSSNISKEKKTKKKWFH